MAFLHFDGDCHVATMMVERGNHMVKEAYADELKKIEEKGHSLRYAQGVIKKINEHREKCPDCRPGPALDPGKKPTHQRPATLDAFTAV